MAVMADFRSSASSMVAIVFVVVILPIWIVLHYYRKIKKCWRASRGLAAQDEKIAE